jgi:spore coat protein JC
MVATIVYQLTRNLSMKEVESSGFGAYFVNHTTGIYPADATGVPFSAAALQVKGDPVTDVHEDLAAEQKARTTYDNILRFADDPDVREPIKFLREREIVHYQRFGEGLRIITDNLDDKNFYAFNPAFDSGAFKNNHPAASSNQNNSNNNSSTASANDSKNDNNSNNNKNPSASAAQNDKSQNKQNAVSAQQTEKESMQSQSENHSKKSSAQPLITWSMK